MKDTHKTDVLFLIEKPEGDFTEDVFAYFPSEEFDLNGNKGAYCHIGQHHSCSPDYASECKEASPDDFKPLMEELESIGYNLNILNK